MKHTAFFLPTTILLVLFSLVIVCLPGTRPVAQAETRRPLTARSGEQAIEQLRATGEYESLAAAFDAARLQSGEEALITERAFLPAAQITGNDSGAGDNFDSSIAVAGDTAIIGAFRDNVGGNSERGSAYIFVRNASGLWTQQAKLIAADGATNDHFGRSVGISGG